MIVDSLKIAKHLALIQRSQWWPADKIQRRQNYALVQSLRYAVANTDYYRSLGINAVDIRSAADLQRFPVLTKQIMQGQQSQLLADGYALDACKTSTTSGSTGEPTTTAFDTNTWLLCKYALKIRRLLAYGIGIGKRVLLVSELNPSEIAASTSVFGAGLLFGQKYVSIHSPVSKVARVIRQYRPHAVYSFPSFLAELIEFTEREQEPAPKIDMIFTSSEVLSDALRERLANTFGANVSDVYGNTEFKEVAWQCHEGRYHINFESAWVETVDSAEDGLGTVLLTTLVNRAMPLIRYRVGDRARSGEGFCNCGRSGPWLAAVSGREVDMLVLAEGRRLSPYLLTSIIELDPGMRRYQIVQTTPNSLVVRYISVSEHMVDEAALSHSLAGTLGQQMRITFRRVKSLPRTTRGKQKVFLREFNAGSSS